VLASTIRQDIDPGQVRAHVERLDEPRGHRHAPEAMGRALEYVVARLREYGWKVTPRPFVMPDGSGAGINLVATLPGQEKASTTYLVGAHLDTVPGSPGADDNASGVACLLEVARVLPGLDLAHEVVLAVFDEEETGLYGSRALAAELAGLAGVVVFECVGYFPAQDGTQRLPPGIALVYPRQYRFMRRRGFRGDWLLLAYRRSAAGLVTALAGHLRQLRGDDAVVLTRDPLDLPVLGRLLRGYSPLVDQFARSDHKPFWDAGIPAVQVTDTADFRNPHYHLDSDTPDTLDYERIADLAAATAALLTRT
jgi:hypothetical protein